MSAFDKVIGYEKVKRELRVYCDCLKNPERYQKIGASMPHGILFEGCWMALLIQLNAKSAKTEPLWDCIILMVCIIIMG